MSFPSSAIHSEYAITATDVYIFIISFIHHSSLCIDQKNTLTHSSIFSMSFISNEYSTKMHFLASFTFFAERFSSNHVVIFRPF